MARELFQAPPQERALPPIPQDKPVYRILSEKGYFGADDTLHTEGSVIVLWDTPNEDMEPMNDMARERQNAYFKQLEESEKLVAKKNGRAFVARARSREDLMANASEDARRIQSLGNPNGVRLMGARRDTKNRVERVGAEEVPATGAQQTAKSIEVLATA